MCFSFLHPSGVHRRPSRADSASSRAPGPSPPARCPRGHGERRDPRLPRAPQGCPERPELGLGPAAATPVGQFCSAHMATLRVPFRRPGLCILTRMKSRPRTRARWRRPRVPAHAPGVWGGAGGQGPTPRQRRRLSSAWSPRPRAPPGQCHGNPVLFKHWSLRCHRRAALGNLIKELAAEDVGELEAFY